MGRDKKGPTAALLSVAKVNPVESWNFLFNQTFSPPFLKGQFVERFAYYLKTWADLGIHHIQFTVVQKEDFIGAQEKPEEHTELIVRVCGYSAYFIDLSRGLQDTVIARTAQCL
jgi:formate C-acetyltransferase